MPLPLVARKSIRDNQSHLETAVERIKVALGVEWAIEIDFDSLQSKMGEAEFAKLNPGETFYRDVASKLADCIEKAAKSEITKEALIESNSQSKVIISLNEDKKNTHYWRYGFNNGALELLFRSICNLSDVANFKLETIIPSAGVYTLQGRLSLKTNEEKINNSLQKIREITKMDWSYCEESLEQIYPSLDKNYQNDIGSLVAQIVENFSNNVAKRCQDEMTLEAFCEATANGKICFQFDPKQGLYWIMKFKGGDIIISFRSICNLSDITHYDFEKLL